MSFPVLLLGFSHTLCSEIRGSGRFGLERCHEFLETDCGRQITTATGKPEYRHRARGVESLDKGSDEEIES